MIPFTRFLSLILLASWLSEIGAVLAEPKYRIGVSVPLTEGAAAYGVDIRNALEFANRNLYNNAFEFVVEDDRCSNRTGTAIAQRFSNVEKVPVVIGFGCSGVVLSAAPIYEQNRVILIASAATSPKITSAGRYIFRTFPSDSASARILHAYAEKNFDKLGVISEETDFAQGLLTSLMAENAQSNLVVANENYLSSVRDFRTILLRLRQKGIDALLINPQSEPGLINIFRQTRDLGWEVPVLGNYYPGSAVLLREFGERADGIVFSDLPPVERILDKEGQSLYERFIQEHGPPNSIELLFVTSIASLHAAFEYLKSEGGGPEVLEGRMFSGPLGDFGFDQNGDLAGMAQVLKVIRNGRVKFLDR